MSSWLAWPIAAVCTVLCLLLWFRDVRRIMRDRKSMVDSAAGQWTACRNKSAEDPYNPRFREVLARSESIYRQALDLYHQALRKPRNRLPAFLMGFRPLPLPEEIPLGTPSSEPLPTEPEPTEQKERYLGSVRFFKNLILLAVVILIAVPTVLSICLGKGLYSTQLNLQELIGQTETMRTEYEQQLAAALQPPEPTEEPIVWPDFRAESPYAELYPDFYAPQKLPTGIREEGVIYLTFDDGPSARTPEVLDVLKEKDVKATFFVVGSKDDWSASMLRRIVEEGHTLAMHSYSHNYNKIYASVEDYLADMYEIFTQIQEATGTTPTLFRFPGGSINGYNRGIYQELISEMLRRGFIPYDWNISSADAASNHPVPVDTLVENVMSGARNTSSGIVLMHDSSAKSTTVAALGTMIDRLREMGFELKELTPQVQPILYTYQD